MTTLRELRSIFRLYREGGHSIRYSARTAWNIAVRGLDF